VQRRRLAVGALYTAVLAALLLLPGPATGPGQHHFLETDRLLTGRASVRDVVVNVAVFVPAGMLVHGGLRGWPVSAAARAAAVLLGGLAVSLGAECAQYVVPGRFSSLTDVLANVAGVGLGLLIDRWRGRRGPGRRGLLHFRP
jgi:hypothetical protein